MNGCTDEDPPDGRNAVQIETVYDGQALAGITPRHSPDGQWIAFTARRSGMRDIAIIPVSGGEATLLTTNGVSFQPTWSPDGAKIAYASQSADGSSSNIFIITAVGGAANAITSGPGPKREPDWSPDGGRIAFSGTDGGSWDWGVWTVPAQGGEAKRLTLHDADEWSPRWSADGDWVYFSTNQSIDSDIDIWKIRASGGEPVAITRFPGDEFSAAPSPDGKRIAYLTDTTGLWTMNLATGARTNVTPGENFHDIVSWSPDGSALVVGHNPNPAIVRKIGFDGTVSDMTMERTAYTPDVSPDGRQIVFFSIDDEGNGDIWKIDADGNTPAVRLTHHPTADFFPAWSPDGQWIAFSSRREGSKMGDIWKIPAEGGEVQRLTSLKNARFPRWCQGGRSLVFQSDVTDDRNPHIWTVPAAGGSPSQITAGGGEVEPDCWGNQLVFSSRDEEGNEIVVHDLKTGVARKLTSDQMSARNPRWSVDGSRILFLSNKEGSWEIYSVLLPEGLPVRITNDGGKKSAPSWSPFGDYFLYSLQLGQPEIWQFPTP